MFMWVELISSLPLEMGEDCELMIIANSSDVPVHCVLYLFHSEIFFHLTAILLMSTRSYGKLFSGIEIQLFSF